MAEQVKDWTTDYDIFDPAYIKNPFPVWDEIRGKCPVAHTERWGGSFMPTRYEDLFNIARDIEHFSSRNVLVADVEAAARRRRATKSRPRKTWRSTTSARRRSRPTRRCTRGRASCSCRRSP